MPTVSSEITVVWSDEDTGAKVEALKDIQPYKEDE
jgi:hypothetical protein